MSLPCLGISLPRNRNSFASVTIHNNFIQIYTWPNKNTNLTPNSLIPYIIKSLITPVPMWTQLWLKGLFQPLTLGVYIICIGCIIIHIRDSKLKFAIQHRFDTKTGWFFLLFTNATPFSSLPVAVLLDYLNDIGNVTICHVTICLNVPKTMVSNCFWLFLLILHVTFRHPTTRGTRSILPQSLLFPHSK